MRARVFDVVTTHALRKTPGVGSQPLNDLATVRQYLSGQGPFAFLDMPWMPVYLGVIFRQQQWLYYYLYGLMVKVPCGTWALFAFVILGRLRQRNRPVPLRDE